MSAIGYTLRIDGSPASGELLARLEQVEVEEHATLADMIRLRFATAVQESGSDWTVDESSFSRLSRLQVEANLGGSRHPLIEAHVIETATSFSNEPGKSYFDVVAMDATVLMTLEEKIRPWPNMADSDIAESIFSEHGLSPVVDGTDLVRQDTETTVLQRGTDIQFLRRLAYRNGFECGVELTSGGSVEGHFHPPRLEDPPQGVLTINMGPATNVNSFNARFDMLRPTSVEADGLEIRGQSAQLSSVSDSSFASLGDRSLFSGDRPRKVLLSDTGLVSTGELQTYAQAVADRSSWAIVAEGELNPAAFGNVLRARRLVSVRGIGRMFSGDYYVHRVLHVFNSQGYSQFFTLRSNSLGLSGREDFVDEAALAS